MHAHKPTHNQLETAMLELTSFQTRLAIAGISTLSTMLTTMLTIIITTNATNVCHAHYHCISYHVHYHVHYITVSATIGHEFPTTRLTGTVYCRDMCIRQDRHTRACNQS